MFKQQLAPRSVHPYQTTMVARSEAQLRAAAQQRSKHPWLDDASVPVYQCAGTDSSNSEVAYHVPHYAQRTLPRSHAEGPSSPVYHSPYNDSPWRQPYHQSRPLPQADSAFSLPLCESTKQVSPHHYVETVDTSPVPSPASPDTTAIGGCGGHCPGFEYVCYYILQIIFVVGILTGISLCIAGSVLRRSNRGGDLGVLVYIGCLASAVCALLLGVQCCVRRDLRHRKRRATAHVQLPLRTLAQTECCPMEPSAPACPLLQPVPQHTYRPPPLGPDEDENGVPWWRRQHN